MGEHFLGGFGEGGKSLVAGKSSGRYVRIVVFSVLVVVVLSVSSAIKTVTTEFVIVDEVVKVLVGVTAVEVIVLALLRVDVTRGIRFVTVFVHATDVG